MKSSKIRDSRLAKQGALNIVWADSQMKALQEVRKRFAREKPLKGLRIGMALHVTKETANLIRTLIAGGAKVAIAGCNPLSTQDDVAAALARDGVNVFAWKGQSQKEYYQNLEAVLSFKPDVTIDDGCDLISLIHQKHRGMLDSLIVGTEETTTGIIRLNAMEKDGALRYPIIAVNDNDTKHLFDNYYGTGQSTIDGILRATSILLAGKTFVVCGYGDCGRGLAGRAAGMGAHVIVTEVNPVRALQARMDGYRVMPLAKAAALGDIFVTVTGDKHVIPFSAVKKMKDGAILANSGHFDHEIDVSAMKKAAKKVTRIRPSLDEFVFTNGKKVHLCGEGRLVNLAAAEGHPSEVMSLSFCGQALAVEYGVKNRGKLAPGLHRLPKSVDEQIARLQLKAMGVSIDSLSREQKKYLSSWEEGT